MGEGVNLSSAHDCLITSGSRAQGLGCCRPHRGPAVEVFPVGLTRI